MYILYFQNDLYNIIWDSEIIHIKWQNPSKVMQYDEFHIKSNPKYKTVGPQLMHSDKGQNQCDLIPSALWHYTSEIMTPDAML